MFLTKKMGTKSVCDCVKSDCLSCCHTVMPCCQWLMLILGTLGGVSHLCQSVEGVYCGEITYGPHSLSTQKKDQLCVGMTSLCIMQ